MASPSLSTTFAFTVLQFTVLVYGAVNFRDFLSFCQATNKSGEYKVVKNLMIILMYSFAPLVVISITFSWVAYDQNWDSGNVFIWLPFVSLLFYFFTVLVTKNDVSNYVEMSRKARAKLPYQGNPPPLVVGVGSIPAPRQPQHASVRIPPPLPHQGNFVDDDDAI